MDNGFEINGQPVGDIRSLSSYKLISQLMKQQQAEHDRLNGLILAELSGRGVFLPAESAPVRRARMGS